MTPEQVREIIINEIGGDWMRTNAHGVDLRACLVDPPRRRTYLDSFNQNVSVELWLVLEEDPNLHSGYEIVFSETERQFGLATSSDDGPVFIGWHGSFLETLEGM